MSNTRRTLKFQRHSKQELFLQELNELLQPAEQLAAAKLRITRPDMPVLLVVGSPRSGTTLLMQWLAASGNFAYPSNLLSRFFKAPYLGTRIQQLITQPDLDYQNELADLHTRTRIAWSSTIGKTHGALEPHEFFYFWRRFFPVDQPERLTPKQLAASDPAGFCAGLAAIERAVSKPLATKAILLQYNIRELANWLPTALFMYTRRVLEFNVQSLLHARQQVLGSRDCWFSVRPPEYNWLRSMDAHSQVAGQVLFTNSHIERQLDELPEQRKLILDYEEFCANPTTIWECLRERLGSSDYVLPAYTGPTQFKCSNDVRSDPTEWEMIKSACAQMQEVQRR